MTTLRGDRRDTARRELHLTSEKEQASMDKALAENEARHALKEERRMELEKHWDYKALMWSDKYIDRFGIDALIDLIPYAGSFIGVLFMIPPLRIAIKKIKSLPLTLAVLYNYLMDALVGLVPFVGPVLDFFFHANSRSAKLVVGYVEDDWELIKEVRRKAVYFAIAIVVLIGLIVLAVWLLGYAFNWIVSLF